MKLNLILAAAVAVGLSAMAPVNRADAGTLISSNGAAACEGTNSSNGNLRLGLHDIRNLTDDEQFVTCALPVIRDFSSDSLAQGAGFDVTAILTTTSGLAQTVTCTAEVSTGGSLRTQSTKSVAISSTAGGRLHFDATDLPTTDSLATASMFCRLPAQSKIGLILVQQPEYFASTP